MTQNADSVRLCGCCDEQVAPRLQGGIQTGWMHVTQAGKPSEPYHYGIGGGRFNMHDACPRVAQIDSSEGR